MSKNYCTIEDLGATFKFIEPSKEAHEAYRQAIKKADEITFKALTVGSGRRFGGIDPARTPSSTVITRYSGGRVVSTETLEDVPPEIPVREYAPPRVPDLNPDDSNHGPACGCDDCEEERNR